MADKAITDLTQAQQITGEDLFVLEQSGEAKKLKGSQVVQYAKDAVAAEVQGVKEYAANAKASADAAAASATKAASAAQGIDEKVAAADASAKAAAASATAAAASATGVDEKVQAAQTAATNAAKSETAAKNAQTAAANAQKAAESAQTGAQSAKTAAESAQEAAESAKDAAAGSSTAAGQKATQAARSAEDAASAKSAAETAKTDAQAARDAIVNMIVEAVTLETGKPATVSKSLVDNVYKLVFGLPRGETGATGPQGATGNGISGIALKSGNHAPGTSDVYTITLTDGTTFDFTVYNGANGAGAGDMLASIYDPQGKHQDVFKYVDDAIGAIPTPDVSGKLDKPANDATATVGQLLTKTADGQEWKDREEDLFVVNMTSNDGTIIASSNKTFNEVQSALSAGKTVVARLHINRSDTGYIADYELVIAAWFVDEAIMFSTLLDNSSAHIIMTPQESSFDYIDFQPKITATGLLKGTDDGVIAATEGTDYVAPDGDGSNVTAAFTAASTRANIATGEKLSVLFGKIAKWFTDLGSLAFKSTVAKSDLASDVQTSLGKADSALQSAPKTTSLIKGDGSGGLAAATPETDFASPVFMRKVTLPVAGWNSSTKQQSVTVTGVLADTTKQCIYPAPVDTSYDSAWNSCGVLCVAQAANSLTFQCSEIPTSAIEVYVTIVTVKYDAVDVVLSGTFSTVSSVPNNCCVVIDGVTYTTAQTLKVPTGTSVTVHVRGNSAANTYINYNGESVASGTNTGNDGHTYTFTVNAKTSIVGAFTSSGPTYYGNIAITQPAA